MSFDGAASRGGRACRNFPFSRSDSFKERHCTIQRQIRKTVVSLVTLDVRISFK